MVLQATAKKQSSKQSFPLKVTIQKSIWTVMSNQMVKHQLPHTRFDQISDHKHDIYLHGKLSTELLLQAANKNTKFMFMKTGQLLFLSMVLKVTVRKNSKQTLPLVEKVTMQKLVLPKFIKLVY